MTLRVLNQKSKHQLAEKQEGRTQYIVMRTGELARRADLNIETLRFYDHDRVMVLVGLHVWMNR